MGWQAKGAAEPEDQGGGGAGREAEGGQTEDGGAVWQEEEKLEDSKEWLDGEVQYAKLRGCQSKRVSFTVSLGVERREVLFSWC